MPSEPNHDPELIAELRRQHETLPRRARDALYGKMAERSAILQMLNDMSLESAARMSSDAALVAQMGGKIERDPLVDHVISLIAGCAHVPEEDRVVVPVGDDDAALAGWSALEREHFSDG